jgi:hypothetical protein
MRCQRCGGLKVIERFTDIQGERYYPLLHAARCLNCGDIEDPVICGNRLRLSSPNSLGVTNSEMK